MSDPYQPTDPTQASQAAVSLTSLPSLEDTQASIKAAIEQVGQQISAIAPGVAFDWRRTASRAGCNPPYEQSDGKQILMPNYVSEVPIPEQNWNQAYSIAKDAAAALGAATITVFKDAPNDHDVQFSDNSGTTLRLGSQVSALVTGGTGCRLPADKH
ncbi:MAG: LppA family lipoprotein [Mycobacterium sp.]